MHKIAIQAWWPWSVADYTSAQRFAAFCERHPQKWSFSAGNVGCSERPLLRMPLTECGEMLSRCMISHRPRPSSPDSNFMHNAGRESQRQFRNKTTSTSVILTISTIIYRVSLRWDYLLCSFKSYNYYKCQF